MRQHGRVKSRFANLVTIAVLIVLDVFTCVVLADQTSTRYALPPLPDGTPSSGGTDTHVDRIVLLVIGVLAALGLGWSGVRVAARKSSGPRWLQPLLAATVLVLFFLAVAWQRPDY